MIEIKDLLFKFDHLLISEEVKKSSIIEAITKVIGISIQKEQVKIKNNIIYLDIKSIYKNEILIKRDKIFSNLESFLGNKHPKEIR